MERKLVVLLVVSLLTISIGQTIFIYYTSLSMVSPTEVTAKATVQSGIIDVCINAAPQLDFNCTTDLTQDVFYTCTLNSSDANNDTLSFSYSVVSGGLLGSIDSNGVYSVTPTQNMTGNSVLQFTVVDDSSCDNNNASLNVSFNADDVNDPPVYTTNIGDLSIQEGTTFRGIFLDDHFTDPDGDPLNYTIFTFSSSFSISIVQATSEVIIIPSECTDGSVIFQAKDPYNLTDDSGVIDLLMSCEEEDDNSGGGGGGGGASSSCKTEWECQGWERCFYNGTQRRKCVDVNGCQDPYEKYFWQECRYVAHCYNNVMDLDEEGVDCGGRDCEICETCYDKKLNNDEVEVDCGGPNCNACSNCADGVQNYQETGLDCGGPSCEPCPSCNDGIQNQNETGIDCGGPYCSACTRIESPILFDDDNADRLNIIILSTFIGIVALAVSYRLFKNQIHAAIAALLLSLAFKKRKQILLKDEQKDFVLERLVSLEKKELLQKNNKVVFQDLLSRLQRQFFSFLIESSAGTQSSLDALEHLKTNKVTKNLLKKHYKYLLKLEKEKNFSKLQLQFALESFRNLVFQISRMQKNEITRTIQEIDEYKSPVTSVILQDLHNAMLASQFSKDRSARKKYLSALDAYQQLDEKRKALVYDELNLTFSHLTYVNSYR